MRKFADYWKLIDDADGRDQTWKRNARIAVLIGLLAECGSHGILDSTQSKFAAERNMDDELMFSSIPTRRAPGPSKFY